MRHKLEAAPEEYPDLLQRLKADFANYKRRVEREREEQTKSANRGLILKLLPSHQMKEGRMNVKIYTTPTCGYCHQAKRFLSEHGVRFTEYDVSVDRAAADEMIRKSGQMGVPVIIVGDQVVVGFDHARLEQLLAGIGNGRRTHFGLQIADASKVTQRSGVVPVFGAFVGKVAPSSLGEKAGLRQGDVITEVNLRPVHNADDLGNALSALTAGSRVAIVFLREQRTLRSEIVI